MRLHSLHSITQGVADVIFPESSLQFYTLIPHRLGRSKAEMAAAIIDTIEKLEEKQELLQLMKDVLKVQRQAWGFALNAVIASILSNSQRSLLLLRHFLLRRL
jgi:hypothetical protein